MSKSARQHTQLSLHGLEMAPAQVLGRIRLVPLLRRDVLDDLRIRSRSYNDDLAVVGLSGQATSPNLAYCGYVPHGLIVSWGDDGMPAAAFGTSLQTRDGTKLKGFGNSSVRILHRMAKREGKNRLRILPMHMAMEGYLAYAFNGPDIAWSEYSQRVMRNGLSPREEWVASGRSIAFLEDALRVFELHDDQVGVLLFVADSLASAFIVSHPDDYRALHDSVIEDFYGETLVHYATIPGTWELEAPSPELLPSASIQDLRDMVSSIRSSWSTIHAEMSRELFERQATSKRLYALGEFELSQMLPDLQPGSENHIGEAIRRKNGTIEYLKTYRLSDAQIKRAYLLSILSEHHWNLAATAGALLNTQEELVLRLERAGFGYMLKPEVITAAKRLESSR